MYIIYAMYLYKTHNFLQIIIQRSLVNILTYHTLLYFTLYNMILDLILACHPTSHSDQVM